LPVARNGGRSRKNMIADNFETCKAIDPDFFSEVVRQDLESPEFEVGEWEVTPISHVKVINTTGGLFCFNGKGWDSRRMRPWSVVLKIVKRPEGEGEEIQEWGYWRRELLAYQSGLLTGLPEGIGAPRCYGVCEHANDGWIWMENIHEDNRLNWDLAHFERAARQLGRFAGAYLVGTPLPNQTWLCRSLFRSIFADGEWWARFINPDSPNNAWQRPIVQKAFPEPLRTRVLQIWAEKWRYIGANERLPQVFCHNDAHRRNLMIRPGANGPEKLIAIDWAFCGPGGIGNDLGELVGTSLSYFEVEPADSEDLETAVLAGYMAGLTAAGWDGDARLARLGYLISLALWWGATLPCATAITLTEEVGVNVAAKYGRPAEAVLPGWVSLAGFALDRADEAHYWMDRLV